MVRSWSYEEELGGRTPDLCKTKLGGRGPRSCETEVSSSEAEVSSGGRDTRRSGDLEVGRPGGRETWRSYGPGGRETRRSWRPGGELVETWRS